MSQKETGGPAFPGLHPSKECRYNEEGMTLRDYFAAKAMNGYLSQNGFMKAMEQDGVGVKEMTEAFYIWADAMLKEREK